MQLKKRELEKVFQKLNMRVKSTHHKIAWFIYNGKKVLKTRVSHGRGDIQNIVTEQIINQLFLRKDQFVDLVKCPLDYDGYVKILKDKKIIKVKPLH
ncbi:hypothetical protein KJ693_05195 [bacterium]|nr:hypothetical protein [bacterium]MBU1614694.1 hypothetical protein [bacterium]